MNVCLVNNNYNPIKHMNIWVMRRGYQFIFSTITQTFVCKINIYIYNHKNHENLDPVTLRCVIHVWTPRANKRLKGVKALTVVNKR